MFTMFTQKCPFPVVAMSLGLAAEVASGLHKGHDSGSLQRLETVAATVAGR